MQESLNVKRYISSHCSGLLIKTFVPNFNSDFGFTLAWCQSCHYCLPWMTKIMIPLVWMASDRQQGVFLNTKHFIAFIVSHYLSFKSCLCIFEDPEYINIKKPKNILLVLYECSMCFPEACALGFKKRQLSYTRTNFWQLYLMAPKKMIVLPKVLMTRGLMACYLFKTGCSHWKKPTCTVAYSLSFKK